MCLYKNKEHHPFNRPLIAREDIVCYKRLHFDYVTNMLVAPYTRVPIPTKCVQKK